METPKASKEERHEEGVSLDPQPTTRSGGAYARVVRGGALAGRKRVLVHLELETTDLMKINFVLFGHAYLVSHIHILLNIELHCIFVPIMQLKRLSIFSLHFVS